MKKEVSQRKKTRFLCPFGFDDGRTCADCFYSWEGGCSLDNKQKKAKNEEQNRKRL